MTGERYYCACPVGPHSGSTYCFRALLFHNCGNVTQHDYLCIRRLPHPGKRLILLQLPRVAMTKKRKRRRQNDRHSVAVVVSYVPLLVDRPVFCTEPDDPELTRLLRTMDECSSGHVDACLWITDGEHVVPVFALEKASEVASHLRMWSEGKPGDWFRLCFAESRGRYTAVLFPDLDRSVRRFQETYRILTGKTVEADEYRVMHVPLGFVSGSKHIFDQVRNRMSIVLTSSFSLFRHRHPR